MQLQLVLIYFYFWPKIKYQKISQKLPKHAENFAAVFVKPDWV